MGAVHRIHEARATPTLGAAATTFLAAVPNDNTRKSHAAAVNALLRELDPEAPLHTLETEAAADLIAQIFRTRWGGKAANTQATRHDGLTAAMNYWRRQGWLAGDPLRRIARPRRPEGLDRAWTRERVEELLTRRALPLRERLLYRMLYETAARVEEVLSLDVQDLDRPNRQAPVTRKGGGGDWIVWQTGTAALLPRYLQGRDRGPLFLTERKARVELPRADLDPESRRARLSYSRTAELWKIHGDPHDGIHLLRHSALTHAAEDGMNTPMLKRKSGHRSLTSLTRYTKPSTEALRRWQEERDPARRKGR